MGVSEMSLSLGIDPGLSGALALLDDHGRILELIDMPTLVVTKTRRRIDALAIVETVDLWATLHGPAINATIEQASIRPNQGASSGFKTGSGFGILLGILTAMLVPYEIISPQRWQKAMLGVVEKGTAKDRARAHAQQLFPKADLGKRKSQDRSDALCIALYGWDRRGSR